MKDAAFVASFVLSFASFATLHLWLSLRLVLRARPRWRGLVSLGVPPLAPIWAFREGWRVPAVLWVFAAVLCVVTRLLAAL